MDDLYWGAIGIYLMGILTGAALTGWSPALPSRWLARREERRRHRTGERMKMLVERAAEKILREQNSP